MSDTDDTDELLLIPPDFFIVYSDTEDIAKPHGPYYKVVDSLITQISKLEDRINCIETSDSSVRSNSLDLSFTSPPRKPSLMSKIRKYNSLDSISNQDVHVASTQSTPQKPRTKIKLNSLPSTPSSSERYVPRKHGPYLHYGQEDKPEMPQLPCTTRYPFHSSTYYNAPSNPRFQNDEILNEIDNFISNVKTIKKYNAAKNLNRQFDEYKLSVHDINDVSERSALNLNDIDKILQDMESQQREIESRLREKEHELGVNKNTVETNKACQQRVWKEGETIGSVPDYGMGMRDIIYAEDSKSKTSKNEPVMMDRDFIHTKDILNKAPVSPKRHVQPLTVSAIGECEPSTSNFSLQNCELAFSDSPSLSSSDSTQLTAYNQNLQSMTKDISPEAGKIHSKALEVLHMHENLLTRNAENSSYIEDKHKKDESTSIPHINSHNLLELKSSLKPKSKNSLVLLSLADLWNKGPSTSGGKEDPSRFVNKLQEEALRRQHCEQLIQQLQTRILELQERLAVAVQVDKAKDDAILQIHKSWEEAVDKVDNSNKQIGILQQQVSDLSTKTSYELSEATKKIGHYESELSKALSLAHGNQERLGELEKQNIQLINELETYKDKLKTLENNYSFELNRNQQLSKILGQKDIELNECKDILSDARKEVAQSKKAVEFCQTELTSMKSSQIQLEQQLSDKFQHTKELEKDKKKLIGDIEMHKKLEKTLQSDLCKQKEIMEKNKMELKNFYQDQVEIVVRDKLKEFQVQLENAESSLHDEVRRRELTVARAAAVHIQHITEKHALEVHLLEEKHKEEIKLHKLQLSQVQQQMENLNAKFQQQQDRKTDIAKQLHKIMEAQWLEAIKIIDDGKSPIVSQDRGTNTMDKLNYLKSRSHNNLEELLFKDDPSDENSSYDKITQSSYQISLETPVSSRPKKNKQQSENELQKYVQMLLNKSPGNPTDEQTVKCQEKFKNFPLDNSQTENCYSYLYGSQMSQSDKMNAEGAKSNKVSSRERSGKPPWK